jgi:hypothetical protein
MSCPKPCVLSALDNISLLCKIWGFHGSLQPPSHAGSSLADCSTLKMEAIRSSETSVHTRSTRRHIPEDGIIPFFSSVSSIHALTSGSRPNARWFRTPSPKTLTLKPERVWVLLSKNRPDIRYSDRVSSWFSSLTKDKCRDKTSTGPQPLPSNSLQIHHHTIHRCIV